MTNKSLLFLISFICLSVITGCGKQDDVYNIRQFISRQQPLGSDEMAFMHISDPHGSNVTVEKMVTILNNTPCMFALMSGDLMANQEMIGLMQQATKPVLPVPGNHDAYQCQGQQGFRNEVIDALENDDLYFDNDSACYYYTDFTHGLHTLRVICLDQYEIDRLERHWDEGMTYTQQQINWLCRVLEKSAYVDGIIIQMHCGFGNKNKGSRDTSHQDTFISKLACNYDNSYDYHWNTDPLMIPSIVNAYTTGENLENVSFPNGMTKSYLHVTTHFDRPHDNFIGYCGGHLHWDLVEQLPAFPSQLQMLVAYGGLGKGNPDYDDLAKTFKGEQSYVINYNTINFKNREIKIKRLGATLTDYNTKRDSITLKY